MIHEAIEKLNNKKNLSEKDMEEVFTEIMQGEVVTEEITAFLLLLKEKKETVEEITGAARVMRKFAEKINVKKENLLDTCGTGGDETGTFNISTIAALVAAGAGCSVAKHGNRSVSSKCGSADLLEALGVNINAENKVVERCINEIGIGFLFAPRLHLAMKHAMPARKKIKTRSIFNILGPLTNPAGARHQLIGVYDEALLITIANVLKNLGSVKAVVVHGKDGLDEITTSDITAVAELIDGKVKPHIIVPENFGFTRTRIGDLKGADAEFNKKIALDILGGKTGPRRDVVLLNAGVAIYVAGLTETLTDGVKRAEESIDSGKALEKLEKLKEVTNRY